MIILSDNLCWPVALEKLSTWLRPPWGQHRCIVHEPWLNFKKMDRLIPNEPQKYLVAPKVNKYFHITAAHFWVWLRFFNFFSPIECRYVCTQRLHHFLHTVPYLCHDGPISFWHICIRAPYPDKRKYVYAIMWFPGSFQNSSWSKIFIILDFATHPIGAMLK